MYIIIKKDKAEHLSEKLRKIKLAACDIIEELEIAAEREYEEDVFRHEHSRHSSHHIDDYDRDYDREREFNKHYSRGRSGSGRGGRY